MPALEVWNEKGEKYIVQCIHFVNQLYGLGIKVELKKLETLLT